MLYEILMVLRVASLLDLSTPITLNFYGQTVKDLYSKTDEYFIINIGRLKNPNLKNVNYELELGNLKINIFTPNSYSELFKFIKSKNFLVHHCIPNNLDNFLINFFLKITSKKLFIISDLGYNPCYSIYKDKNFFQKIKFFFIFKIEYYVLRILIFFLILPKIDFFFEASDHVINSIKNGISYKLEKKFSFLKISYYKKVIKINSKFYKKQTLDNLAEDYIVFLDGMLFDHSDVIMREGNSFKTKRHKYYKNVNKILNELSNIYKKPVIVCLHPKNNFSIERNDFPNFKCVKFQTQNYVQKAFIVLFHEGSSIIQAILLKKKIICLNGKILGSYVNERCELYINSPGLINFDIENFDIQNKDSDVLLNKLDQTTLNFEQYIEDNIVNDRTLLGIDQVIGYLNKNIHINV